MNHKFPERCNCGALDCQKCRPGDWNRPRKGEYQECSICGNPTGRCQEDQLLLADLIVCEDCYDEAGT